MRNIDVKLPDEHFVLRAATPVLPSTGKSKLGTLGSVHAYEMCSNKD